MSIAGGTDMARVLARTAPGLQASIVNESIRFESRGAVLVIGPGQYVTSVAARLAVSLRVLACATSGEISQTDLHDNPSLLSCRVTAVKGYLGRFTATAQGKDGNIDLGLFSANRDGFFDLVLDLNSPPLLSTAVKPLGYYAPGTDSTAIDVAIAELTTFTGSFWKPRFYNFNAELCAHSAQGVVGCTRCLNVCPTGAISSLAETISIDSNLCQGCATCVLACPTGAIAYTAPSLVDIHKRLATILAEAVGPGCEAPQLLIYEDNDQSVDECLGTVDRPSVGFAVPAIALAGPDVWIAALARGSAQVIVSLPADLPESTRGELKAQAEVAQAVLAAMGDVAERITIIDGTQPIARVTRHDGLAQQSHPVVSRGATKRDVLFAGLEQLQNSAAADGIVMPASVELSANAPFGTVEVNPHSCTLCMACTYLCPTGALFSETALPQLSFVESRCVQCHICEHACPEKSITLKPRLLFDANTRQTARTLNQDVQHHCPECAAPFIGRALLDRSRKIMRDQQLLNHNELNGLRLCPSCRARNIANF